ncbi:putative MFS hexose transporter [Cadophora sp. DSE1049]|nr:putative MFS hexose transporter [Cadophora sp. DSE1049]
MIADSPPWYKVPSLIRLYFLLIAPLLTSTAWGFDLSMTNGLQSVSTFMDNFGNPTGATLGFFGASMSVGGIVACIVGGPLNDRFGRRALCSAGAAIVAGMAIMQTFSTNFHMFAGAKLLLGFGSNLQQVAAPVLVTELAHPKQRVAISSLYNTSIYIGLIIGAWITFGTYNMNSQWAWKLPCILQVMLPGYQVLMVWLCPESPRWLISKGRIEEARSILIKYHGSGIETDLVKHEMQEIIAGIEADKTQFDLNWNSFKSIIGTKGNRHRLWIGVMTAVGSQSLGGSFVAVYLPQILDQIGYTSSKEKTLINGIMSICNWVTSFVAALIIPYVGRRTIFLTSTTGMTVTFIIWTAFTAQYSVDARKSYGLVVLAMIFIYNVFTTICWIPLVIAYPLETVTTKQRGIFFALTMLCINTAAFVSSYINPIGLDAIGWRYYIPQCVFNTLFIFIIYFTFVETKGLTLEEIAVLFDGEESFQDGAVADALAIEKAKHKDQDFSHVEEIIDSKV